MNNTHTYVLVRTHGHTDILLYTHAHTRTESVHISFGILFFTGVLSAHTGGVAAGSASSQSPHVEEEGAELHSMWDSEDVVEVKGSGWQSWLKLVLMW